MKRARMKATSDRRRKRDAGYAKAREAVFERSEWTCEWGLFKFERGWREVCTRWPTDVHHKAGRGGPDPHRLDNLLALCREHHDYVHANPEWSREYGLMRTRHRGDAA